ncbi:MAG: outer membrane protein assembly factor BamB [Gammaproteobacteria bacterium]|nr:outer membrane protein assembly factor BamB [Gammaproteobacteria bacterium]MCP5135490.1 outer membrane protein assembly factor BamB [Gammaproteobacteria bacterium]
MLKPVIRSAALSLLILGLGGCSTISDWMFGGDDNREPPAELTPLSSSIGINQLWSASAGTGVGEDWIRFRPAVNGGRVYVAGRDGEVRALNAASGATIWSIDLDMPLSSGAAVGDGLVLVSGDNGELIALSDTDGTERWRVPLTAPALSPAVVKTGIVVVRTVDGNIAGFDVPTGGRVWVYPRRVPALTMRGVSAPVLVGKNGVLSGSDSGKLSLVTLEKGFPVWERDIAVASGNSELARMVDIDGDPVVVGNIVFAVAFQGRAAALNVQDGQALWSRELSSSVGLGADTEQVYVTDEKSDVWSLDISTGASLWRQTDLHRRQLTAPVAIGKYVAVGDFEGYVHWLSREDGRLVGRIQVDAGGILGPMVESDGVLYVQGRGGNVVALRPGA